MCGWSTVAKGYCIFGETAASVICYVMVKFRKVELFEFPIDREIRKEKHRIAVRKHDQKKKAADPKEWKRMQMLKKRKQRLSKEFREKEKARAAELVKEKKAYAALLRRVNKEERELKAKSVPKMVTRTATRVLRGVGIPVTKARIEEFFALTLGKKAVKVHK